MPKSLEADVILNARGLRCPMPVLRAQKLLRNMQAGQVVLIESSDNASSTEIPAFCKQAGHILMHHEENGDIWRFWVCCG